MEFEKTILKDIFIIKPNITEDDRGTFVKVYNDVEFTKQGARFELNELFYSINKRNVIRGMHFQVPPVDHDKLVVVYKGRIIDAILDLRNNSPSYGEHVSVELSDKNKYGLLIPKGFAHGFLSLEDDSIVSYHTSTGYNPDFDRGIKWDSFGMNWGSGPFIISDRDKNHPLFSKFQSPFNYGN